MELNKKNIAAQLEEAADLLDVLNEDAFRAKAFRNASRNIEAYEGDIGVLISENRLHEIKGIGASLAKELSSLREHELLPLLEELYSKVPEGVRSLFSVSGIGPKKIAALWQQGISNLEDLLEAAQDGRIADMKGFGKKSADNIAESAAFALNAQKRMRLDVADVYAAVVLQALQNQLPKARIEFSGSYRRRLETIGNLNVVLSGATTEEVANALASIAEILEVTDWQVKAQLEGRDIIVSMTDDPSFASVLLLQTGNYEYRQTLLAAASAHGFEFREEGLLESGKVVAASDEKAILKKLELPFIVPERREEASPKPVEKLIKLADIHGQIHNHSSWSDAVHSIREMVEACRVRGFKYLGMADHSRTSYYANGLSIERVVAQAEEIAEIREKLKKEGSDFELLHGIEVDILPDGSLDYPDEVLAALDYTVVSVHQNFTLAEKSQTDRIIRAVQHPYAKILGHATGRLILRRPSYAVDQQAVIEACAEAGTVIEINASPYRLDMDWRWVIKAKELGCKFSINPDAHHIDGFDDLRYGVDMARKAGLSPEDVVNTAPTGYAFLQHLKE